MKLKPTRQLLALSNWRCINTTPTTSITPVTTFRTLPHELRQQILLQTFDTSAPFSDLSNHVRRVRLDETERWAALLRSVGYCLIGDVNFVATKWNENSQKTCSEQGKVFIDRFAVAREKLLDRKTSLVDALEVLLEMGSVARGRYGDMRKTYASVLKS